MLTEFDLEKSVTPNPLLDNPTTEPPIPIGLLLAADRDDTTAMRALADFLRERGLPPREIGGSSEPGDEELARGFLQMAHECEQASVMLRQLGELLSTIDPPGRQPFPARPRATAIRSRAKRIERYLRGVGIELVVVPGARFDARLASGGDRGSYTVLLPRSGEDQSALVRRLLHHLAAAFPTVRLHAATSPYFRHDHAWTADFFTLVAVARHGGIAT